MSLIKTYVKKQEERNRWSIFRCKNSRNLALIQRFFRSGEGLGFCVAIRMESGMRWSVSLFSPSPFKQSIGHVLLSLLHISKKTSRARDSPVPPAEKIFEICTSNLARSRFLILPDQKNLFFTEAQSMIDNHLLKIFWLINI